MINIYKEAEKIRKKIKENNTCKIALLGQPGTGRLTKTYTIDFLIDRMESCKKIISNFSGWGIANGLNPIPRLNGELDLEILRNLFKEIRDSFGLSDVILEDVPSSLRPLAQKVLLDWFTRDWIFTQTKNVEGNEIVKNYSLLMPIVGQIWGVINGHKLVESLGQSYLSDCHELAEKILEAELTVLNVNIDRLRDELHYHQVKRKIAIIGQPGSGKSTMLDIITFYQLDPRPKTGQQTDATDWSRSIDVKLLDFHQKTIYVDVPGYNTSTHPTESIVNHLPFEEFDMILFVIKGKVHEADNRVWISIKGKNMQKNTLFIRSFADGLDPYEEREVLDDFKKHFGQECIFISNRSKKGFSNLMYFLNLHPSKMEKIMS